jgi:chromosome segregation ATPase
MNFLQQNDFNKISKYVIRLRKSFETNDVNKVREYYDHLKYHIQLGGANDNLDELTKKFDIVDDIIKKISSKPDNKTFNQLNGELIKCNNEKEDYTKQIASLKNQINELKKELIDETKTEERIKKLSAEHDQTIQNLNKQIDELNELNNGLNEQIKTITGENNSSVQKFKDLERSLEELFRISKIFGKDSDKNIKDLEEKITKYTNIIHKIENESKVTNLNETGELDKVESALKVIFARLQETNSLKEQLQNLTTENKKLQDQIEKQKNIIKELERVNTDFEDLEKLVELKEKEIIKLTDRIKELETKVGQMEEDKNNNDKYIDKVANEFDEKIRALLKTIYGNDSLVNELMQGVKIGETAEK